jgi:hypothetical protein
VIKTAERTVIKAMEGTVIKAMEDMMTGIAEAMTGIDVTSAETLTIIVKAMKNRVPMSVSW